MPKPCQTRNLLIINNVLKQSVHFRTLTLSESGHFHLILDIAIVKIGDKSVKVIMK